MENDSKVQGKEQRYKNVVFFGKRKYSGQFLGELRDGKGREEDKAKNTIYEGYFQDDKYHGEGTLYHELTKCYFKGIFEKNQKKAGIEIFPNGDIYEGQYKDDKFHGKGYIRNGDLFYFVDDGKAVSAKDYKKMQSTYSYEGGFFEGKKHGYGTETYLKGAVYVGEFRNNQRHGKGKLSYPNGSYYEGDFVNGLACGFGIHVAHSEEQISSIKPIKHTQHRQMQSFKQIANVKSFAALKGSEDTLQDIESSQQLHVIRREEHEEHNIFLNENQQPEYYYEGEFMDGFKHGTGRLYFPDGSYYYCEWAFNQKTKNIVYYDAPQNRHCFFRYRDLDYVQNHFSQFTPLIEDQNIVSTPMKIGYPPDNMDGHKNMIDTCALNGDQFEDEEFKSIDSSLNFPDSQSKRVMLDIDFIKLKENPEFYYENKDLFEYSIQPNTLVYNQLSDYQLVTCLEALSHYPHIFFKIFTNKYDITDIGFISIKLYLDGGWKEIILDDIFPFYDSQRESIFTTTIVKEFGWLIVQKAFCKIQSTYFGHKHDQKTYKVEDYFQTLSGLPSKSISWDDYIDEEQKHNIKKIINSKQPSCKICYPKKSFCDSLDIPLNFPYIILEVVDLTQQSQQTSNNAENPNSQISSDSSHGNQNYENLFIIMKSIDASNSKIKKQSRDKTISSKNAQALADVLERHRAIPENYMAHYKRCRESNDVVPNIKLADFEEYKERLKQSIFAIDYLSFFELFCSVYELNGVNQNFQSSIDVQEEISVQQGENKYFFSFSLNLPSKILINVEQHIKKINQQLPVRIVLAEDKLGNIAQKERDPNQFNDGTEVIARNKKDFLRRKFVKKVKQKKQIETSKRDKNQSKQDKDKNQSDVMSQGEQHEKSQRKIEDEHSHAQDNKQFYKQKYYNLKYIFGKGQYKKKNIFKTISLKEGTYILMVQVEGPDIRQLQEEKESKKEFNLRLVLNIFGDNLFKIQQVQHPENFTRQVYEGCIHQAEKRYLANQAKQLKNQVQDIRFQRSDLGDRENGSDQIIICQYYLQEEGTYLQLLDNRTDNKCWRQKLYFITENMKLFEQHDSNKVDVYLTPHTDYLIIIHQVKGGVYRLEGGEGICLIENLQKNVDSDENEDLDDN